MCAVHALNAALGGPHFKRRDLLVAVGIVVSEQLACALEAREVCSDSWQNHMSEAGWFSEEAIACALRQDGRWEFDQTRLSLKRDSDDALWSGEIAGALVNVHQHWLALRVHSGDLWEIDSLRPTPRRLGDASSAAAKAVFKRYSHIFPLRKVQQALAPAALPMRPVAAAAGAPPAALAEKGEASAAPSGSQLPLWDACAEEGGATAAVRGTAPLQGWPTQSSLGDVPQCSAGAIVDDGVHGTGATLAVACPAASALSKADAERLLPPTFAGEQLKRDAEELLRLYVADPEGTAARNFLAELPMFKTEAHEPAVDLGQCEEVYYRALRLLAYNTVNGRAALSCAVYLGDVVPYPLAVLFEACARATSTPAVFIGDTVLALANSIVHKETAVQLGRWKSKSRYWVVGTANRAEGKSPCTKPIVKALEAALKAHPGMAPGHANDRFHLEQSATQASAEDKVRCTKGYLTIQSDEAGTLLCERSATGAATDRNRHIDLQFWLNAAHGDEVSHSKLSLRLGAAKKRVKNPSEKAEGPETGIYIDPTNVHMLLLQQEPYFNRFWAQGLKHNDTGLAQRCLFTFGGYGNPVPTAWFGFYEDLAVPLFKDLFETVLLSVGPHCDSHTFKRTPRQGKVTQDIEECTKIFGRSFRIDANFQGAMPKSMYWIGTVAMLGHILEHCLPAALARSPCHRAMPEAIGDAAFWAAHMFAARRYLFGQAIIAKSVQEESWIGADVPTEHPVSADEHMVLRVLRGATGSRITEEDIIFADLDLKRTLRKGTAAEESAARNRIERVWHLLEERRVGEILESEQGKVLVKYRPAFLTSTVRTWLQENRIPLQLWGLEYVAPVDATAAAAEAPAAREAPDATLLSAPPSPAAARRLEDARGASADTNPTSAGAGAGAVSPRAQTQIASGTDKTPSPRATMRSIAMCESTQGEVWSQDAFKEKCQRWLQQHSTCSRWVRTSCSDEELTRTAECTASAMCKVKWRFHYTLAPGQVAAQTFFVEEVGKHDHSDGVKDSGKIWEAHGLPTAIAYVNAAAKPTLRGLKVALAQAHVVRLPTDGQMSNWLKRRGKCKETMGDATSQPTRVETTRAVIEEWLPREAERRSLADLYVMAPYTLSGNRVFVRIGSDGMASVIRKYNFPRVHLAVDGKHNTLQRGWVVSTVSILVKDEPRPTRLQHETPGKRGSVSGRASTTRALAIMQAVMENDNVTEHAIQLFTAVCDLWRAIRGEELAEKVKQVHKDFADSYENARRHVFPRSRPVDCFFHLTEKGRSIAAKCRELTVVRGKYVKANYDMAMHALYCLRHTPTGPLFSVLWQAFLARLVVLGETVLADYFRREYTTLATAQQMAAMSAGAPVDLQYDGDFAFSGFWDGLFAIFPGTACGNNTQESMHSDWQKELQALGGKAGVHEICERMQALYHKWSETVPWTAAGELSPIPRGLDPSLLHGVLLPQVGRAPAVAMAQRAEVSSHVYRVFDVTPTCCVVALERAPGSGLDGDAAAQGVEALVCTSADLADKLARMGILEAHDVHDDTVKVLEALQLPQLQRGVPGGLLRAGHVNIYKNTAYRRHFVDVVYVFVTNDPERLCSSSCTCAGCLRYYHCEHQVFVESLQLRVRAATRDFADLPSQRPRGRPKGSMKARGRAGAMRALQ